MTRSQQEAIRARLAAATPWPWKASEGWIMANNEQSEDAVVWGNEYGVHMEDNDAEFIANAPEDIFMLLTALSEEKTLGDINWENQVQIRNDLDYWKTRAEAAEAENAKITAEYNRLADGLYTAHKAKEYLERLKAAEAYIEALERFKLYWDNLYGQGLEVENWHMNGETVPLENFYDSAVEEMENGTGG